MLIKRIVHEDSSSIILQPEDWTNVGHRLAYNLYREYNEYHQKIRQQGSINTHKNEMLYTHDQNATWRILQTNINLIIFLILIA